MDKYQYYKFISENKHYSINVEDCKELFKKFGSEDVTREYLKNEPYYVLIDILGKQFKLADYLIINRNPVLRNSEQRAEYLMLWALKENEFTGSSKMKIRDMAEICDEYCHELTTILKKVAINSERIYYEDETKWISSQNTYLGECAIAEFVKDRLKKENIMKWDIDWKKYQHGDNMDLTDEQIELLHLICENNIVVVNAKAGTGKTSSLKAVIDMCLDNQKTFTLLSPTGKVAQRIKKLTNFEASTIHRKVMSEMIDTDLVVVEEFSMIDIKLLNLLISGCTNVHSKFLFIGDLGQIATLGVGCPMRDIVASNSVPVGKLSFVFRYKEGGISKVGDDAYRGKEYLPKYISEKTYFGDKKDYVFVPSNNSVEQAMEEYSILLKKYDKKDITVITYWNITEFGTINLNNKIQEIVNPVLDDDCFKYNTRGSFVNIHKDDIVMNTKNNYEVISNEYNNFVESDTDDEEDFNGETYHAIFNGEMGIVKNASKDFLVIDFDGRVVYMDKLQAQNISLGYAVNSYKMQGSENKCCLIVSNVSFQKSMNKNIMYTNLTRGRELVVEIGEPSTIKNSLLIDGIKERNTWLLELLTGGINNG